MSERTHWIPADALGLSREEESLIDILGKKMGIKKTGKENWEHFTPEFVGTKTQHVDVDSLHKQIYEAQTSYQEARISQTEGLVKFDTDLPVTIFTIGDIHYGSIFTDYKRFTEEIKEIKETPNTYITLMSNLIDNAIPAQYPSNMLNNAISPDHQVVAMRKIVQELDESGKILGAVTSPCHEGWTWRHTGQDINALIFGFEGRKFPVLENGGLLKLQFPKTEYNMFLYHKIGPFRSNFNLTHGLKQMNRLKLGMEGDIVVGAHYHNAAVEQVFDRSGKESRPITYIQSGTYKGIDEIKDQWSVGIYGSTGQPTAQSVTLWTNERRMDPHLEYSTGMLAHESIYLAEIARRDERK